MSRKNFSDSVSQFFTRFFGTKVLLLLIIVTILAIGFSLWDRYIYIDDAFFGEQAYYLATDGIVKVPSMPGFLSCDTQLFSYHKLNIFFGAGLIKVFGWSITPLRSLTLLFLILLLWMVVRYCKQNPEQYSKKHIPVVIFVLLCNPLIVQYAFTFRPEIWVTSFGFISYIFIHQVVQLRNPALNSVYAGIFAGLAFLTHLNGLIFPIAGFIGLIVFKKYRYLLTYVISGGMVGLLYFWDLWQANHFDKWLFQLKNWPDNNATNYLSDNIWQLILNILDKLSHEHQRFFWSDRSWGISVLFLVTLIMGFKYLKKNHPLLLIYTFTLILSLNIAGGQIAERFLIYFFPFFGLIISLSIIKIAEKAYTIPKIVLVVFVMAQLFFTGKMFVFMYHIKNDFPKHHDEIFSQIPDHQSRILVPYEMVYNNLVTHNLVSFKGFEYAEALNKKRFTQEAFFRKADSLKIEYIVLPKMVGEFHYATIPALKDLHIESNLYYSEFINNTQVIILKNKPITDAK